MCSSKHCLKIKARLFCIAWHGIYSYEVGALQHTRFPQCTINKARKLMPFIAQNFNSQVRQLLINSHTLKHEVTRHRLINLSAMCFL